MRGLNVWATGRPLPTGALTKSIKSASLYTANLSEKFSHFSYYAGEAAYRFAALAVSITLPPPTL